MGTNDIDRLYHRAELSLPGEGGEIHLAPGRASAELDAWLQERGVESLVFLTALPLGKEPKEKKARRREEKLRAAVGDRSAIPGSLVTTESREPIPGLFLPDLKRAAGREIARKIGVPWFYWCRVGSAFEVHRTGALDGENVFEADGSFFRATWYGLADLAHSLVELALDPRPLLALVGARGRNLAAIVVALVALGFAAYATSTEDPRPSTETVQGAIETAGTSGTHDPTEVGPEVTATADADDEDDGSWRPLRILLHPVLLPAILIGTLLRSRRRRDGGFTRELTLHETEEAWREVAPQIAGAWLLALLGVGVLEAAREAAGGSLDVVDLFEDGSRGLVICLWILPAFAYARDGDDVIGRAFTAFFGAVFAIIGLKLTLLFAGFGTRILWGILGALLPHALPEALVAIGDAVVAIAAQATFLGLILGFVWTKERESYGRWASGEPTA